jgi:acyl-CoA thioesterase
METIREFFRNDRFAAENGMEMVELRPGYARTRLIVSERHLNSIGTIQGGAIFTLADLAFAGACNAAGFLAVGLNMNISCLKAVSSGTLVAEASELARSSRISTCTVRVTDESGDLIALFQGTAYIKGSPFPPNP